MKISDKSFIFIVVLFVFSGFVSWNFHFKEYSQTDTVDIHRFPAQIDAWSSKEIPITEEEYAILETRNAFARRYTHPDGREVLLLLVYSQNNRKVSHPPEVCYTGSGVDILNNVRDEIKVPQMDLVIRTNRLLLELGDIQQVSCYWFKVGDTFTPNYWRQQILIALKTLVGKPASSALIRMASTVDEEAPQKASETIEEFTQLITPLLFKHLP